MGIYYKRPDVIENPSNPVFTDDYTIYYGNVEAHVLSKKSACITRYVFHYNNGSFSFHHKSLGLRHYNNSSVIDVDILNNYNNLYVESKYDLSAGQKDSIPNYYAPNYKPIADLVNILINNTLPKLIISPQNNEFYFVEGMVSKWTKYFTNYNIGGTGNNYWDFLPPGTTINPKHEFVYKIYRYGVCNVENIVLPSGQWRKQQFTYKIVKTIDRNSISFTQLQDAG